MSQEDLNLSSNLEKLEIQNFSIRKRQPEGSINPFMRRRSKSLSSINFGTTCECTKKIQNIKHTTSFKRSNKKLLRDPVLKYVKCFHNHDCNREKNKSDFIGSEHYERLFGQCSSKDQDFKSIIDGCGQLNINTCDMNRFTNPSFLNARSQTVSAPRTDSTSIGTSCSHQARMNTAPPCDVTIDELASYFETFVHIPKKMSSMAEMMYI